MRHLIFRSGKDFYGIPLNQVAEVVGRTTPHKGADDKFVVDIRNQQIPCITMPWTIAGSTSVVANTSRGIGAIVVETVCGIYRNSECKFHPPPLSLPQQELNRVTSIIEDESSGLRASGLNIETIINQIDPEFRGVSELSLPKSVQSGKLKKSDHLIIEVPLPEIKVGLRVLAVERIIPFRKASQVAGLHGFAMGVINVEGSIIPLIDLQMRLGKETQSPSNRIVVLNIHGAKWGLAVPSLANLSEAPFDIETAEVHPMGSLFKRPDSPDLLIVDPEKLISF